MGISLKIPKVKVCLVEDDPLILELYLAKLHQASNFEIFSAADGVEGFDLIKKTKPDIALIDVMMPNMDGKELISKIRKDPDLVNLPIIVLTNVDDPKTVSQLSKFDVKFYLVKSLHTPAKVLDIIRETLKLS